MKLELSQHEAIALGHILEGYQNNLSDELGDNADNGTASLMAQLGRGRLTMTDTLLGKLVDILDEEFLELSDD